MLQELYFVAAKEGKIKTLKDGKRWFNEQERVDAPQVAAKRWRAIKPQHAGKDIRLREWRDSQGQYMVQGTEESEIGLQCMNHRFAALTSGRKIFSRKTFIRPGWTGT